MDLFGIYKSFLAEVFLWRNYKRMGKVKAVLAGIVMLPFTLFFAFMMFIYGATLIMHKFLNAPTDYIYSFVKKEGDEVKHGTQAVIYFVSFPLVLLLKALSGLLIFNLFIIHFVSVIVGYLSTLGGINVSLFLFDKKGEATYETESYKPKTATIFVAIGLTLLILSMTLTPIVGGIGALVGVIDQTVTQNKSYTYEEFLQAVEDRYQDGDMSSSEYDNFEYRVRMGYISEYNYESYIDEYLPNTNAGLNALKNGILSGIGMIIAFVASLGIGVLYELFVIIYILAALRLRRKPEEVEAPAVA